MRRLLIAVICMHLLTEISETLDLAEYSNGHTILSLIIDDTIWTCSVPDLTSYNYLHLNLLTILQHYYIYKMAITQIIPSYVA